MLLEPCKDVKYEARTLSYDRNTFLSSTSEGSNSAEIASEYNQSQTDSGPPNSVANKTEIDREEAKYGTEILFYYATTSIQIVTEDRMINFSNFVSAVGGNLGLFVGFSFLGFFSLFYKTSKRICKKVYSI